MSAIGAVDFGFTSGNSGLGGFTLDPAIWFGIDNPNPVTPNGQPTSGTQTASSDPWWATLAKLGLGAFNSYEQYDLANEALARNSSLSYVNGKPTVGGLNLNAILPWILLLVGVMVVLKIVGK